MCWHLTDALILVIHFKALFKAYEIILFAVQQFSILVSRITLILSHSILVPVPICKLKK